MIKQRLNIPAVLVHTVNNKKYRLNGTILSINESNDTCKMRFKGNIIEDNIPMNKILVSEGFLDKIKDYGKKIINYVTKKVKGFIAVVDSAADKLFPWSLCNVGNLAIKAAKGDMPEGVYFAPSNSLKKIAGVGGMTIDEAFAESEENDLRNINKFWKRVIQRAGTTPNETIEESVKYVNEKYYRLNPRFDKALNENVVYSYDDVKFGEHQVSDYGIAMKSKKLKATIINNIRKQISGPLGGHASMVPLLIWGAPGIGKTAIIKQSIKELSRSKLQAINLNLEVIMLAGYTIENWTLPKDYTRNVNGVELRTFSDTPKAWLPVYVQSSDPEENKKRDEFCNTCQFLSDEASRYKTTKHVDGDTEEVGFVMPNDSGKEFEGGVVFMDEYSRVAPNVQNIIMGLANDHKFGDNYVVASKWGFLFASNRAIDEGEPDSDDVRYYPTAAQNDRFIHVTYVPDKKEWIEWARMVNENTGEANVEPFIVDFIEASDDHVWYSTVVNGGYDDLLENPESDKRAHEQKGGRDAVGDVLDQEGLKTKRMTTPRKWANIISYSFRQELKILFDQNNEGLTGEEYYDKLVKDSIIEKTDDKGKSYKEYYGGILPNLLVDALNDLDDEVWEAWYEEKGGDEELNPAHDIYGKRARYNIFMNWFINDVRMNMGDTSGTNAATATSPVMQAWRSYQSYSKHFTPEVIDSIWKTGQMPEMYQKDDNKMPINSNEFKNTEYSKWKQFTGICEEVIEQVWQHYPGDLSNDLNSDIKKIKNASPIPAAKLKAEAEKLNDEYTITLNNKKIKLLFDAKDLADNATLMNKVIILQNSKVAQNFAHIATWIAKIAIQTSMGKLANDYLNNIFNIFKELNSDDAKEFMNDAKIKEIQSKRNKDPKNAALREEYRVASSQIGIMAAGNILSRAKSFDFDKFKK